MHAGNYLPTVYLVRKQAFCVGCPLWLDSLAQRQFSLIHCPELPAQSHPL